jgi:hypothetical protein
MLEYLFGSKPRANLLQLLLAAEPQPYTAADLTRLSDCSPAFLRAELAKLIKFDVVNQRVGKDKVTGKRTVVYSVNTDAPLYSELHALCLKAQLLFDKKYLAQLDPHNRIKLMILTGFFTNAQGINSDMVIVGNIAKENVAEALVHIERNLQHEVNYTIMTETEYQYRQDIADGFIRAVMSQPHLVVIDRLTKKTIN